MAALRSTDRILTTHVGSLPRPDDLRDMLVERNAGKADGDAAFDARVRSAVAEVVARQVATGIDAVDDGEFGKFAYQTYVVDRLTGLGGETDTARTHPGDVLDYPTYAARFAGGWGKMPATDGPIATKTTAPLERDLRNFADAVAAAKPVTTFLTAASPGLIASFIENRTFASHEKYLEALVAAMKPEYEAIVAAGFDLQLDCPDLASARKTIYMQKSDAEFKRLQEQAVDAINAATANIPADRMRMHICWGNYEGPHHRDIPLERVLPTAVKARPAAILFEGANPRHDHEWIYFKSFKLPDDKVVVPGCIDSTTNFIEHPELVAQRIEKYAGVVGKERVVAGVDCGFGTSIRQQNQVDTEIMWAKLAALVQGAKIASERLGF
jgi:5-methyltetrahydropteroyltriglutamate--homocysteine methyltransferase